MPVTMLGSQTGAALAAAYASFDIFVHTGTEETFGQTIQEAHASGLPVVAPRAGGPIDLIDNGTDGFLFGARDDAALRASVVALARDPELRSRMGEAGRRRVLSRSWESICGELLGHYESVVSAKVTERSPVLS